MADWPSKPRSGRGRGCTTSVRPRTPQVLVRGGTMPVVVSSEGVVTLADANFFEGLLLLADSLRKVYDVPIVCFDGGLTAAQRQSARTRLPRVEVSPIPD